MIKEFAKRFLSAFLAVLLVASAAPKEIEAQQAAPTGYSGQGVPLTAEELQQLTGSIALVSRCAGGSDSWRFNLS